MKSIIKDRKASEGVRMVDREQGFWFRLGSGFVLGLAMVVPGVSGGVLAMALGIYEPMVAAIARPLKNWRQHLRFFVPLALGAGACVLLLSRVLQFFIEAYHVPTVYFFFGLVLAGLPPIVRQANAQGFGLSHGMSLAFGAALLLVVRALPQASGPTWANLGLWGTALKGSIVGGALVIPGLSVSMLLLALGIYEELLAAVAQIDLAVLLPAAIGFVPGLWIVSKAMNWLFERRIGQVYHAILGLMLGSLAAAFPGFPRWGWERLFCILLFACGLWIASFFNRRS